MKVNLGNQRADNFSEFIITVIGGRPHKFSVQLQPVGPDSMNRKQEISRAYLFNGTGQSNPEDNLEFDVKVSSQLKKLFFAENEHGLHDLAISFGLESIRNDPSISEVVLTTDEYKRIQSLPRKEGQALKAEILRFVFDTNELWPNESISPVDLQDNGIGSDRDARNWLNRLVDEGLLERARRFKRHSRDRGKPDITSYLIAPKARNDVIKELEQFKNSQNPPAKSNDGAPPRDEQGSMPRVQKWDFFICHASEDKASAVEPLAKELVARGAKVWYDDWSLAIGDSLSEKIDQGLLQSRYGIVVLSKQFFNKAWAKKELAGLVQKEIGGKKVILPVWHEVDHAFVASHSPTLADKLAGSTKNGFGALAAELVTAAHLDTDLRTTNITKKTTNGYAIVTVGYEKLSITQLHHRYSLTLNVALTAAPDQGRLRIKLYWPSDIPIVDKTRILTKGSKTIGDLEYEELVVDYEQRVFPGESVQILGPDSDHRLVYDFNDRVYSAVSRTPRDLKYEVFFEDHEPILGSKSFGDLHIF